MRSKLPLACSLGESGLSLRRQTVLKEISIAIQGVQELPFGFQFRMPGGVAWKMKLEEFVRFEQSCCPFLSIELETVDSTIWLRVTGPDDAKEFIRSELGMVK